MSVDRALISYSRTCVGAVMSVWLCEALMDRSRDWTKRTMTGSEIPSRTRTSAPTVRPTRGPPRSPPPRRSASTRPPREWLARRGTRASQRRGGPGLVCRARTRPRWASPTGHAPAPNVARTFQHIELGARNELGVRRAVRLRKPDGGRGASPRRDRLGRAGHELTVEQAALPPAHTQLRSIGDRPFRAEVERSAPSALVDGQQLDPDLHVARGAVGSHVRVPCVRR